MAGDSVVLGETGIEKFFLIAIAPVAIGGLCTPIFVGIFLGSLTITDVVLSLGGFY